MRKPLSKNYQPTVLALEDRRLLTIGPIGLGGILAPPNFDYVLSATVETSSTGNIYVDVDGSDDSDVVRILEFQPGALGYVSIQLEQYVGTKKVFSKTARYHGSFSSTYPVVVVQGKGGNDTIRNDTDAWMDAYGGAGNDTIVGGLGRNYLYGATGNDPLVGGPTNSYLNGGDGDDLLEGGASPDALHGGTGNDTIFGGGGADQIFGGDGHDVIQGGEGGDLIYAEGGNDRVFAGGGDDTVYGGAGDDFVQGEFGNDVLSGDDLSDSAPGGGNDTLSGAVGDDLLIGGGGDDFLFGDENNDTLLGNDGGDVLFGGVGDDYLDGGYNDPEFLFDVLEGGPGADTFVRHRSLRPNFDRDLFKDFITQQGDKIKSIFHL